MSDRKYRQHGYQESDRNRRPASGPRPQTPKEPRDPRMPRDPRVPNMPGFREVFRCARCGRLERTDVLPLGACGGCGVPLHACIHCDSFDPGALFECRQVLAARVSPKDTANDCASYAPRVQVERETGSTPAQADGTSSAKKAFDDLFKF